MKNNTQFSSRLIGSLQNAGMEVWAIFAGQMKADEKGIYCQLICRKSKLLIFDDTLQSSSNLKIY